MRRVFALLIVIWSIFLNIGGNEAKQTRAHLTNDDIPDKEPIVEDDRPLTNGQYGVRRSITQKARSRIIQSDED